MKVTQVAISPSQASTGAGRPALTPELLAASGARYSRNNEGLESILAKIDPNNLEKSVDSIFRMVDYGHQSIADMVPVAMFIDGVSIWLAYYVWTLCPTAGGQESSTRYLKISSDSLVPPEQLGIEPQEEQEWRNLMEQGFAAYESSLGIWEQVASEDPTVMGIPKLLLADSSDSAQKKVARLRRNFAFDRARYFLPAAAATNVMLIMSARGWVALCQNLLSHPLPECRRLGEFVRSELEIAAPRMVKHARASEAHQRAFDYEFKRIIQCAKAQPELAGPAGPSALPFLTVSAPEGVSSGGFARDLEFHANRYSPFGSNLMRTAVTFGWSAISFAEIRDLNRHRTGNKYCPQIPAGFYFAEDQLPGNAASREGKLRELDRAAAKGRAASQKALDGLRAGNPRYLYWVLLGTEFPFEHTTTADKFLYEAELRTGLGAHFRYARHLRDVLALWYRRFPQTKGLVLEGSAEPE